MYKFRLDIVINMCTRDIAENAVPSSRSSRGCRCPGCSQELEQQLIRGRGISRRGGQEETQDWGADAQHGRAEEQWGGS